MEPQNLLNSLDYIVIGVVLLSGILALMRGLLHEVFSLIAWVGAYFAARYFYAPAVPFVHNYLKTEKTAEWGAMALVFVIVLIALIIVGNVLCGMIKGPTLTWINRFSGMLYGLFRGALIVCLIYMSARMVIWPDIDAPAGEEQETEENSTSAPDMLVKAKTRPLMAKGADVLLVLVPKEMLAKTTPNVEQQKEEAAKRLEGAPPPPDEEKPSKEEAEDKKEPFDIDKLFSTGNSK